jgi:3-methyladenine DNA glycosylase AlkD
VKTHQCNSEKELEELKKKINEIHKAIVGNGKPGLNSDMRVAFQTLEEHNAKINRIESTVNKLDLKLAFYAGAIAVIVFVITYVPKWM